MNRSDMLKKLKQEFDVIIIGGGATGLGASVDAASRGFQTLLVEQSDFAKATSSRSTKLIHGGLRYLKQGNIHLVTEALKERGLLCENAPHLVGHLAFLVPSYHWWEGPFYGMGLKVYDMLAGSLGLEKSKTLSKAKTLEKIPALEPKHLRGGTIYYDGQFDDSRLAITLARTAADFGAVLLNYMPVFGLIKERGKITGVKIRDLESGKEYSIRAKVVINATGIFSDKIRKMDDSKSKSIITPAQGIHLVLESSFLKSDTAIMVPSTDDGRVLFIVPWHGHILLGTTDTPVKNAVLEPQPLMEEIDFLLKHAARYLTKNPQKKDVLSAFAGLRPLVTLDKETNTSKVSREHVILVSSSKLITISGGKWTTYRKMAEDVIDKAIEVASLASEPCQTEHLHLHGYQEGSLGVDSWSVYGSDALQLSQIMKENSDLGKPLHPKLKYIDVEVIWASRFEMAQKIEDVLARRTRALFLNAQAAIEMAPKVAELMAKEQGHDASWVQKEIKEFTHLAKTYQVDLKKS